MAYYGQKNYNELMGGGNGGAPARYTIAQVGCFLTAFCNLELRFGTDVDPPTLNRLFTQRGIYGDIDDGVKDDLAWQSITAYDGQLHTTTVNNNAQGQWPGSDNAIVKFAFTSPRTGEPTTHFCLVADHAAHTIIDSWDGMVRVPGYYGSPVAYAAYDHVVPQSVVAATPPAPVSMATSGLVYIMKPGDTVWALAMKYGLSAQSIMEHNGIVDPRSIPVGFAMRIPIGNTSAPKDSGYTIELFLDAAGTPITRPYHVSKPGGCEKWGFGNLKARSDLVTNGHVAEYTNLELGASAHVTVAGESLDYYLDTLALGDYATTGRVANTIGFDPADVSEGSVEKPTPPPTPEPPPQPTVAPKPPAAPAAPAATVVPHPILDVRPLVNSARYKATIHPLFPDRRIVRFLFKKDLTIPELDGRHTWHVHKWDNVDARCGFFVDNEEYLLPISHEKTGLWPLIPRNQVDSEDELFNPELNADEQPQSTGHHLTLIERLYWIPLAIILSQYMRLKALFVSNKRKDHHDPTTTTHVR